MQGKEFQQKAATSIVATAATSTNLEEAKYHYHFGGLNLDRTNAPGRALLVAITDWKMN